MTVSTEAALSLSPPATAAPASKRKLQSFAWDEIARDRARFRAWIDREIMQVEARVR